MNLAALGIGGIVDSISRAADDLFTSDEERLKYALQEKEIEAGLVSGQLEVNRTEAQHKSLFVAGWRPFIGWVGGFALVYQFILYPLMTWIWAWAQAKGYLPQELQPPPVLDAEALWVIITGMLGVAGMRTFDKMKGSQTDVIGLLRRKGGKNL